MDFLTTALVKIAKRDFRDVARALRGAAAACPNATSDVQVTLSKGDAEVIADILETLCRDGNEKLLLRALDWKARRGPPGRLEGPRRTEAIQAFLNLRREGVSWADAAEQVAAQFATSKSVIEAALKAARQQFPRWFKQDR